MKASDRRAVRRAMEDLRCPECNARGRCMATSSANWFCYACGFYGTYKAVFVEKPARSGFKVTAAVVLDT